MSETQEMQSPYINILSDFGFKWYFGREENKVNLINFLNTLLAGEHTVVELTYANVEEYGDVPTERKVVLDLRCIGAGGEVFLVEMQLGEQEFFFERSVICTSRAISRLAKKGMEGNNKPKTDLPTILDQWMYLLKHTHEMNQLSNYLDKRIFSRIFEIGELANLTPEEHMSYLTSLDRKRDYDNTIAFAEKKGLIKGRAESEAKAHAEKLAAAKEFKKSGVSNEIISNSLGLSLAAVEKL